MKKLLFACAAAVFALAGCATNTAPTPVLIPTPVPCAAAQEAPARPVLPLKNIDSAAEPAAVIRAYAASVGLLQGYSEALEQLLGACK